MMRRFLARTGALLTTAAFTAACTGGPGTATDGWSPPTETAATSTPKAAADKAQPYTGDEAPQPVAHAPVKAADSSLGRILVDADGRTLYYFTKEEDGVPSCYDECAATWTPYLTQGAPEPGKGATSDLLGTAERTDDTTQVTYAGRPLYFHVKDTEPGQVTGDAVKQFGGEWHVLTPKGERP
ncbi:hypothetical protein AB0K60_29050 [Thermopolyspora sp. NPDC052614]|uniref:COG4315 family predicted lipoprotein n=1 Tax=Thermopolyspora sp. NPDC052614 TaxID=3155682 RepID=UPI00342F94CD